MSQNHNLYGWYFHFNTYTELWNAVRREHLNHYMNGTLKADECIKHRNITDLMRYINGLKHEDITIKSVYRDTKKLKKKD